jgi:TonB family protein
LWLELFTTKYTKKLTRNTNIVIHKKFKSRFPCKLLYIRTLLVFGQILNKKTMELLLYLIKANMAIALLYGLYRLLFRGDTFFRCKRLTLLLIPAVALLYPLMPLPGGADSPGAIESGSALPVYYLSEIAVTPGSALRPEPLWGNETMLRAAAMAYLAGAAALLARIALQTLSILMFVRKAKPGVLYGAKIYARKGTPAPFSFFTRIVLDAEKYSESELRQILLHEEAHVRQRHSFDLMAAEVAAACCWLNPCAWLLKREIRINLEYIADRAVLQAGCEAERYQLSLLRLSYRKAIAPITNNFNVSQLKKRIKMMNRKKTSPASIWKYTLLAPAFAALSLFNESLRAEIPQPNPVAEAVGLPAPADENARSGEANPKTKEQNAPQKATLTFTPPIYRDSVPFALVKDGATEKAVYKFVSEMPKFPGGDKALLQYLAESVKYPIAAHSEGVQGRVIVRFTVSDSGKVENAEIISPLHPHCDAEVRRIVEAMPAWTPGKEKGKPVNVYYTLPVVFRLE